MKKDEAHLGKWISMIYRHLHTYLSRELKPYNLGSGQYIFLMRLYKIDGICQEELTKWLHIDKATTARAIKKLEEEGYVTRKVCTNDKRAYRVYITDKALEIKPKIITILNQGADILEKDLTLEEKDIAIKLLRKMAENSEIFVKDN